MLPKAVRHKTDEEVGEQYAQDRKKAEILQRLDQEIALAAAGERTLSPFFSGSALNRGKDIPYNEEPWHRHAAYYYANGMSVNDIAKQCEKDRSTVFYLVRKPQFQAQVTAIIEANGMDIMSLFKGEAMNSLLTLLQLRDDEKVSPNTRANIATGIIDRVCGKATQVIEHKAAESSDPVKQAAAYEAEAKRLRESLEPSSN